MTDVPTGRQILAQITRDHVLEGIRSFDLGVKGRFKDSKKYDLLFEGKRYPPKAIVGLAGEQLLGRPMVPTDLEGGDGSYGANRVLKRLGFEIVRKHGRGVTGGQLVLPQAWAKALQRVEKAKRHPYYMWAALLVALDLLEEGELDAGIAFAEFQPLFEELLGEVEPEGKRRASMPFFHLSQSAAIWDLSVDGQPFAGTEAKVDDTCIARFAVDLTAGLEDASPRAAVVEAIRRRSPADLAAAHRFLRSRRQSEDDGAELWQACGKLLAALAMKGQHPTREEPAFQLARQVQELAAAAATDLVPSPHWSSAASVGKGQWARTPWFAVMDTRITRSAKQGVYIVGHFLPAREGGHLRVGLGVSLDGYGTESAGRSTQVRGDVDSWSLEALRSVGFAIDRGPAVGEQEELRDAMVVQKVYRQEQLDDEAPELTDDLRRLLCAYVTWAERSHDAEPGPAPVLSARAAIDALESAAGAKGLVYGRELLISTYLSLRTKPFCLLAGATGTGKSRLARLFEDVGAVVQVEPVEPSWTDGTSVIGYRDLDGDFRPGVLARHAEAARKDPDRPYILVLDELNLARVEHYLAQWLSVIESRALLNGEVVADALTRETEEPLRLPANLLVIGTVNMDESTFAFSQRVLDRANVIALTSPPSLLPGSAIGSSSWESGQLGASAFKPAAISWQDLEGLAAEPVMSTILDGLRRFLQPTHDALSDPTNGARARISYRLRDEICCYLLHGLEEGLDLTLEQLIDQQLQQRVLPKLCDGSAFLSKRLVTALLQAWEGLGTTARAPELLRRVEARQREEDMPASIWSVLA